MLYIRFQVSNCENQYMTFVLPFLASQHVKYMSLPILLTSNTDKYNVNVHNEPMQLTSDSLGFSCNISHIPLHRLRLN